MKILVPFQVRDIGGPSTFANKFKRGMEKRGHQVTFCESDQYDIVLVIVQAPFRLLSRARATKKPIVQRLDGIFYWTTSRWMFPLLNLKALIIRHCFADYTIYQSEYSRRSAQRFLGLKHHESASVIYNGVDTELFSPHGETHNLRDFPEQKVFFTASEFRRRDQLIPILEALSWYHDHSSTAFKFVIAGNFSREFLGFERELKQYPWVQFLGKIANKDLPTYERGSDVFLFTHLNPPCPNNVLEAIACGLPVVGVADGAMPELVTTGKEGLLLSVQGEAFWQGRVYDTQQFAKHIDAVLANSDVLAQASRQRAEKQFSLESMLDQYETVLKNLL